MSITRQQRLRLGTLYVLIGLFFVVAAARLVHLQIFEHGRYAEIVKRQSQGTVSIPAARGLIYDRNGKVVADNIVLSSAYAYPADRKELARVAAFIEDFFKLPSGTAIRKYSLAPGRFRWIKRRLNDADADRLAATAPKGVYLRQENQRSYPFGLVGKQILGFTDIDNCGQSGLELTWDSVLAGQPGRADIHRDGLRNTFRVNETALVKPAPGRSTVLTIDWRMQEIVEEELRAAVVKHNAKSAMAVFIDCNSGDILSMAHYDPKEKHPERPTKLRAISDQYEPGSVFKPLTAAGAIEAGLIDYADSINCEGGKWRLGRRTLHDDKKHDWLDFRRVMELSSNIGTAKYAIKLGGEELFETAGRFGLGQKLRIGLPGEARGRLVAPERWSDYNIAALAMGHSVAVTSLQMAAAFGAIANGGELLRPNLVRGHVDDQGYVTQTNRRQLVGRVMSRETSDTLISLLRGVVDSGTAEPTKSPLIALAGKTGTAEVPDLENRRYFKNRFIASFAGLFPAENPLVAGIVVVEEPHPVHYGGWTAGPAFRAVAERYAALSPDFFSAPERTLVEADRDGGHTVEAPDLVGRHLSEAQTLAIRNGVGLRANAEDGIVVWQFPPADRLIFDGDEILVAVADMAGDEALMADLRGLSVREASAYLDFIGLDFEITGTGRVVTQSIRPGQKVSANSACRLKCRPA